MDYNTALMECLKKSYFNYYIDNFDDWYYETSNNKPFVIGLNDILKLFKKKLSLKWKKFYYSNKKLENKLNNIIGDIHLMYLIYSLF